MQYDYDVSNKDDKSLYDNGIESIQEKADKLLKVITSTIDRVSATNTAMLETTSRDLDTLTIHINAAITSGIHANRFEFEFGNREDRCMFIARGIDNKYLEQMRDLFSAMYHKSTCVNVCPNAYTCVAAHCGVASYVKECMQTAREGKHDTIMILACPMHYEKIKRVPYITIKSVYMFAHTESQKLFVVFARDGHGTHRAAGLLEL